MKYILSAFMLSITLAVDPVSAGTIYKCVSSEGTTVYQETPCHTKNHHVEIELQESSRSDKELNEQEQSIKDLKRKADTQYFERKIDEREAKINSLKKSRDKRVDYLRALIMHQKEPVQVDKLEKIIDSVRDYYQRRIDKEDQKKSKLEEKLKELNK